MRLTDLEATLGTVWSAKAGRALGGFVDNGSHNPMGMTPLQGLLPSGGVFWRKERHIGDVCAAFCLILSDHERPGAKSGGH